MSPFTQQMPSQKIQCALKSCKSTVYLYVKCYSFLDRFFVCRKVCDFYWVILKFCETQPIILLSLNGLYIAKNMPSKPGLHLPISVRSQQLPLRKKKIKQNRTLPLISKLSLKVHGTSTENCCYRLLSLFFIHCHNSFHLHSYPL